MLFACFPRAPVGVNKQWHRVDKNLYRSYAVVGFIYSLKTEISFSENISTQEKINIDKK